MIDELGSMLDDFPGAENQTCCFLHIINLVAKSVLRQFESPIILVINYSTSRILAEKRSG